MYTNEEKWAFVDGLNVVCLENQKYCISSFICIFVHVCQFCVCLSSGVCQFCKYVCTVSYTKVVCVYAHFLSSECVQWTLWSVLLLCASRQKTQMNVWAHAAALVPFSLLFLYLRVFFCAHPFFLMCVSLFLCVPV